MAGDVGQERNGKVEEIMGIETIFVGIAGFVGICFLGLMAIWGGSFFMSYMGEKIVRSLERKREK